MRPKNSGTLKKDKTYSYYYLCTLKEKSRGKKCKCTNIKGLEIDKKIAELLKNIFVPNVEIYYELKNMKLKKILNSEYNEIKILENEYRKNKKEISNIIDKLKYIDNDLTELVNKNLRKIRNDNEKIMNKINKIKNNNLLKKVDNVENKNALYIINNYFNSFNLLDLKTKRDILSIFIKNIYVSYDGKKNVEVNLLDEVIDQKKKDFFIFNSNFFYKKMSPDNNSRCT
jgi:site-specific DNA recombinase